MLMTLGPVSVLSLVPIYRPLPFSPSLRLEGGRVVGSTGSLSSTPMGVVAVKLAVVPPRGVSDRSGERDGDPETGLRVVETASDLVH